MVSPKDRVFQHHATRHAYIVVHDGTVQAAYDGLPQVGRSSDKEGHGKQEEGGGGVQLHRQVLSGEGGGGQPSQVAKHLIDSDSYFCSILYHLENHGEPTVSLIQAVCPANLEQTPIFTIL